MSSYSIYSKTTWDYIAIWCPMLITYCCVTNYPKMWLKTTFTILEFLRAGIWVWFCGSSMSLRGCRGSVSWGSGLTQTLECRNNTSKLAQVVVGRIWLLRGLQFLARELVLHGLLVGDLTQFLATWFSPKGHSQHGCWLLSESVSKKKEKEHPRGEPQSLYNLVS